MLDLRMMKIRFTYEDIIVILRNFLRTRHQFTRAGTLDCDILPSVALFSGLETKERP